ncbi:transglutaminase domain-containing protein [Candidatus Daviesbacteria bacterium]|nr:transglutaminase domain-containing protein [Candidatus Daviesbacteria bacterium]
MKKIIYCVIILPVLLFTFYFLLFTPVFAAGEFATSYNITYDVLPSGETEVEEDVKLRNLTDRFYASSFTLSIGATSISDVTASDSQGQIPVEVSKNNTKTNITVRFTSQVVGKDKEYLWKLRFKSKDFAQAQGKIWQVSVPKISSLEDLDNYSLVLSIPVSFGDPTSITPEPKKQTEAGGRLNLYFTKEQLSDSGVLANFGTDQTFEFQANFQIYNKSIVPALARIPLPADTEYQQVMIQNINPKPENVIKDGDGNYIAWFKADKRQSLKVEVSGLARLSFKSKKKTELSTDEIITYTSSQKYWEKDTPQIKNKLAEVFKDKKINSNSEKARLIHKFISSFLQYDQSRLNEKNFQRLGALTALSNPDKALCSEFTDLFVAMARSAGVPARALIGYAYTSNNDLRPLSFGDSILHAWPEYFDPDLGWVMVDPTWENTTGGVDYFSKLDLNHFVLLTRGLSSEDPLPPGEVSVKFSDAEFKPSAKINLSIDAQPEIFAAFPAKATVRVENSGNAVAPISNLSFSAANLKIVGDNPVGVPGLPPFGSFKYEYDLRTNNLWESYDDILQLKVGEETIEKKVRIKPFFAYQYFAPVVISIILLMVGIYAGILYLRLKNRNDYNLKPR